MKRIIASIFVTIILASYASASIGSPNTNTVTLPATDLKDHRLTNEEVTMITERLKEIQKLSKSNLTKTQRQELRQEVLSIKERLTDPVGGGIYISAGALILIIILLIIIL